MIEPLKEAGELKDVTNVLDVPNKLEDLSKMRSIWGIVSADDVARRSATM